MHNRCWWALALVLLFWAAAGCTSPLISRPASTQAIGQEEIPTSTPPGSPTPEGLAEFYSPELKLGLSYPASWSLLDGDPGSEHYGGADGTFRASAIASGGMTLDELALAEANHALQPFGVSA